MTEASARWAAAALPAARVCRETRLAQQQRACRGHGLWRWPATQPILPPFRARLPQVLPYFLFYRGAQGKLEGFGASAKKLHLIQ